MATSRTLSAPRASCSLYRLPPFAIAQMGYAQPVVEGDQSYIVKDAQVVLRRSHSLYSSTFSRKIGSNLHELLSNSMPSLLSIKTLRSFSTIGDVDTLHTRHSNFSKPTASQHNNNNYDNPPEPIPNRPLRGERRAPINGSFQQQSQQRTQTRFGENEDHPPPQNEQFNRPRFGENENAQRETGAVEDSDFLEKFKLGRFDRNKGENANSRLPSYNSQRGGEKNDQAAVDSPPLSQPPEDADEIFRKMKETGLIPNAVAMLDGLCKDGLVQEAMKLFGLMRERGTIPEVVIYTAVVEGFCKAHKPDDAVRIFKKMQSIGITPNAFSYGILIQGMLRLKRLDDAREFGLEMLENGHSPNVVTFIGLVDAYCREKGLEEAQAMINSLREKGFCLNEKPVREHLEKRGPFLPLVWEAIFGKKSSERSSVFS